MFDKVVVGIDDYEAGRDALELAKQLVSTGGDVLIVFVQVVVLAPGTDSDPAWQVAERQRAEERLLALRAEAHVDAQLLEAQAPGPRRTATAPRRRPLAPIGARWRPAASR